MSRPRNKSDHHRAPVLAMAVAVLGVTLGLNPSQAQDATAPIAVPEQLAAVDPAQAALPKVAPALAKPYYIEFRSRSAQSYGHTFSMYGRLNGQGKIASKTVAGLHPFSESTVPWMVGHLFIVPSETGASDGDTEDEYVTARFRVVMNQEEYKKVTNFIKGLQKKSPVWHAVLYNCNAFVGDIAKFMGMEVPTSTMLMPADYINGLRDLNISRTAGVTGTPVKVDDASKLRAEAFKALERREKAAAPRATRSAKPADPAGAKPPVERAGAKPSQPTGTTAAPPPDRHT
jgi:hypothetical protein